MALAFLVAGGSARANAGTTLPAIQSRVEREYPGLFQIYTNLHAHPELSFQEEQTAARLATELTQAGYQVTTGIGRRGVVAVLTNGAGPTILVRADMDGLPVKEQTGLPYASTVTAKDPQGKEVPVMHACGHDIHVACLVGTARVLAALTNQWRGTLVLIGQPAEEIGSGSRAMLADGLFQRFPRPDFCLALHDNPELPAGTVGYTPGYSHANVDSVDITVRGIGGHGAYPHKTKDPVVLAAQIILALQTIASREAKPEDPVVVTVGAINGGSKNNVIPDEVRLQLTVRTCSDESRRRTIESIKRIARGEALAAGMPEDHLPEVKHSDSHTPALFNDPPLAERAAKVFRDCFGETNVIQRQPGMGGEDFAEYGRVSPKIPICMFSLGAANPTAVAESRRSGAALPSLHSSLWAPDPEPTLKTGVIAMSALVLELAGTQTKAAKEGASDKAKPQPAAPGASTGSWKAGVATATMTPTNRLWLAGYAGRTHPAEGTATDLNLKALAVEDAAGHRAVIITADLLAIRGSLYRKCLPRFKEEFGLEPAQVLLTASHTHCGPMLPNRPGSLSAFDAPQQKLIEQYADQLADQILNVTGRALKDLEPVTLGAAQSETGFAANRRNNAEADRPALAAQGALRGPVEHSVPVLAVSRPDGTLKAILFGYACHNTTLTKDSYRWCADYAGFAKAALERKYPGSTALFFAGCAGDQDPVVRGTVELARQYGNSLASAVEQALRAPTPLAPTLSTRMEFVTLNLGPAPTIAELREFEHDRTGYVQRWATNILAQLNAGQSLERTYPYPMQAWEFGGKQLLLTLGGEPVADYALKFKHEFGTNTWIAGYANDVMCYIPSLRVLNEDKPPRASALWGYEGSDAMKVLGLPALRWADDVEDLITAGAQRLVKQTPGL
jgi:hippurate hydrolase